MLFILKLLLAIILLPIAISAIICTIWIGCIVLGALIELIKDMIEVIQDTINKKGE